MCKEKEKMEKKQENGAQFQAVLKALCYCGQKFALWRSNSSLLDCMKKQHPDFSLEEDHTPEALSMPSLRVFEINLINFPSGTV